jgi:hypothetical protein
VSRYDRKIDGDGDGPIDSAEILAALAKDKAGFDRRHNAVSRCLSAGEDWREASAELGGAFAPANAWLRRKEDE